MMREWARHRCLTGKSNAERTQTAPALQPGIKRYMSSDIILTVDRVLPVRARLDCSMRAIKQPQLPSPSLKV